ncbi:hypothetical protein H9P43_001018 [Blastocladiella emersonii ATCC 22665]|nr:hypothetical protein H9P43_001018 [Blastocladiella emersonii ATCC 22665]
MASTSSDCAVVAQFQFVALPANVTATDCCKVPGVSCEAGDRVTALRFTRHTINGTIPDAIGSLSSLVLLDLSTNQLSGPIPSSITNLRRLRALDLSRNVLNGSLPAELDKLDQLASLIVTDNQLTGRIPDGVFKMNRLAALDLSVNRLEGSLPDSLGNMVGLQTLDLSKNQLSGTIPATIERLSQLQELILAYNKLEGTIPRGIGKLKTLSHLSLAFNNLTGPIPAAALGNLTSLHTLDLSENLLSGQIPMTLAHLKELEFLALNKNRLTGPVPPLPPVLIDCTLMRPARTVAEDPEGNDFSCLVNPDPALRMCYNGLAEHNLRTCTTAELDAATRASAESDGPADLAAGTGAGFNWITAVLVPILAVAALAMGFVLWRQRQKRKTRGAAWFALGGGGEAPTPGPSRAGDAPEREFVPSVSGPSSARVLASAALAVGEKPRGGGSGGHELVPMGDLDLGTATTALADEEADGCSKSGNACDASRGCQGNCRAIPDPAKCDDFKSALFPNLTATDSVTLAIPARRPAECGDTVPVHALHPCELVEAMGGADECPYCTYYYDRLREAAEMYDVAAGDCSRSGYGATRYASFLAQVRHETGSLTTLHQPLDNGAGGLHMIPRQWLTAIDAVPRLKEAWAKEPMFRGITDDQMKNIESNKTLERFVGLWLQWPENAFGYSAWWMPAGAALLEEPECGDLRVQMDIGLGSWDRKRNISSGYYEVSRCIYGSLWDDWGRDARLKVWQAVYPVTQKWKSDGYYHSPGIGAGGIAGIVVSAVLVVILGIFGIYFRRMKLNTPGTPKAKSSDATLSMAGSQSTERLTPAQPQRTASQVA